MKLRQMWAFVPGEHEESDPRSFSTDVPFGNAPEPVAVLALPNGEQHKVYAPARERVGFLAGR